MASSLGSQENLFDLQGKVTLATRSAGRSDGCRVPPIYEKRRHDGR